MRFVYKFLAVTLLCLFLFICFNGERRAGMQRKAVKPVYPERIVSLSLSSDEILHSLVARKRILALTYLAADSGISNIADSLAGINNFIKVDPEIILDLKPDLVITSSFVNPEAVAVLRKFGIPVAVYDQSDKLSKIYQNIRFVAKAVGEEARGEAMIKAMQNEIKQQPEKELTCLYYSLDGVVSGRGTQFDELLHLAGFTNAASGISGRKSIDREKLIELNPDIIFVPVWYVNKDAREGEGLVSSLLHDPALARVGAIKNKRVYPLTDKHIICSSQYIAEGWRDLVRFSNLAEGGKSE